MSNYYKYTTIPKGIKVVNFKEASVTDGKDYFAEFEEEHKLNESPDALKTDKPVLSVKVIACQELMAVDQSTLADAYVMLELHGTKFKTKTVKKTLEPIFKQTFVFDIDPNKYNEMAVYAYSSAKLRADDFLGVVYLDLADILKDSPKVKDWYEFTPRTWGEPVRGEVHLKFETNTKLIPQIPVRERKKGIFDLDLTEAQRVEILRPEAKPSHAHLVQVTKTGESLLKFIKLLTADMTSAADEKPASVAPVTTPEKRKRINSLFRSRKPKGPQWSFVMEEDWSKDSGGKDEPVVSEGASGLPEELLYNVFLFLNAMQRINASRVCRQWCRILGDSSLKAPAVECLELIQLAAANNDPNTINKACEKILPIIVCLDNIVAWNATGYTQFGFSHENILSVCEKIALVDALMAYVELLCRYDMWLKSLGAICPQIKSLFTFFENNHGTAMLGTSIEAYDVLKIKLDFSFWSSLNGFFSLNSMMDDVLSRMITSEHFGQAVVEIMSTAVQMIKKKRFTSEKEVKYCVRVISNMFIIMSAMKQTIKAKLSINLRKEKRKIFKMVEKYKHLLPKWQWEKTQYYINFV